MRRCIFFVFMSVTVISFSLFSMTPHNDYAAIYTAAFQQMPDQRSQDFEGLLKNHIQELLDAKLTPEEQKISDPTHYSFARFYNELRQRKGPNKSLPLSAEDQRSIASFLLSHASITDVRACWDRFSTKINIQDESKRAVLMQFENLCIQRFSFTVTSDLKK